MQRIILGLFVSATLLGMVTAVDGRGGIGGGSARGAGGRPGGNSGGGQGFNSFSGTSGASHPGGSPASTPSSSGWGGRSASGSYDHTWSNAAGGSISTSGSRGAYEGRAGGVAAGGSRDTTVTTASGHSYSGSREAGVVSGPKDRTVAGAAGTAGTAGWHEAFAGNRYTGNMQHYASLYGANGVHSTAYWSAGYMNVHAGYIRSGFGYYGAFHPAWYRAHPGCWFAPGWVAGAAWANPSYINVTNFCGLSAASPPSYDYGSNIVYQNNNVYISGTESGTSQQFAQQATDLAGQGQTATAPPTDDWQPLGVFALVQGDEKTSNNIFQLAINKAGVIRGNYYDGLMDATTEVYGSVDKTTQRAAWTIGKKQDRVFEAGLYNLTQPQCPCLLHVGTQTTSQLLLVRMEQPKTGS